MSARSLLVLGALCCVGSESARAQRMPSSCEQLESSARANPDNLDLAVALGRCVVRDEQIVPLRGDSSRMVFRSNWSVAVRALRHAVQTNPNLAAAYRPLMRMLFAEMRDGCDYVSGICEFVAPIAREGDSLNTIPRRVVANGSRYTYDESQATYDAVRRESLSSRMANLAEARTLATAWAAVAPNDYRPHEYIGRALLGLGDARGAADELEHAAALGTVESRRGIFWDRVEALIKSDRGADARRAIDEAAADPGRDTTRMFASQLVDLDALLGRKRAPPPPDTALVRKLRARMDSIVQAAPPPTARRMRPGVKQLIAAGDTASARAELARQDSLLMPHDHRRFSSDEGEMLLFSAQQHLALGDTAIAEARLASLEEFFNERPFRYNRHLLMSDPRRWTGQAWLLTGDVMASRGRVEEAKKMYRRVTGLWGGGDPEVTPLVDSAQARLAALATRNR